VRKHAVREQMSDPGTAEGRSLIAPLSSQFPIHAFASMISSETEHELV